MEFPSLGKHCSSPHCHQLDFLPFACAHCHQDFCLDHRTPEAHSCQHVKEAQLIPCPACEVKLHVKRNENVDHVIAVHLSSGNCEPKKKDDKGKCSFGRCKKRELLPVLCKFCHHSFCLSHRFPTDHQCNEAKHLLAPTVTITKAKATTVNPTVPPVADNCAVQHHKATNVASRSRLLSAASNTSSSSSSSSTSTSSPSSSSNPQPRTIFVK